MKYFVFATVLLLFSKVQGQAFDSTKFYVTEAIINDDDYTDYYLENRQFLAFYNNKDGTPCLINSTKNGDEFSCGKIIGLKSEQIEENDSFGELVTFRWYYHNSYDLDSGYAMVSLKKISRENGTQFTFKIITKQLEIIIFSGFTNEHLVKKQQDKKSIQNIGYLITKNL